MSMTKPYVPNAQAEFRWAVYERDRYVGQVTTSRNSEADARLAARDKYGPGAYRVQLLQ
jgi:hypothetical protein